VIQRLARDFMELIYPAACPVCREATGGPWLCGTCAAGLDGVAAAPACSRCALPVATEGAVCPWCAGRSFAPFEKIVALGRFRDPLKQLIHHAKFHRQWTVGERLADRLLEEDRVKALLTGADVLVAVPLHWSRQIDRGYNQAEVVARALGRRCRLKVARAIVRTKNTQPQTTLKARAERARNVRGAFKLVRPGAVEGKRVVLIDDVMTTAATIRSAARAMRAARPASLCAIVLAVADPRSRDFEAI
jgi:ComF family protein